MLYAQSAASAELEQVSVTRFNDLYLLDFIVLIDVSETNVRGVLEDPDRYVFINPAIRDIEQLPGPNQDALRVRFHVNECVWFFCVEYINVYDVEVRENQDIAVRLVPEMSDFEVSNTLWHTEVLSETKTRLRFYGEIKPSFWVPPLIGMPIIKSRLRELAMLSAHRMECAYREDLQCEHALESW
jgi:hypothetical protein